MKNKTKFNFLALGLGFVTTFILLMDRGTYDIAIFVGIGVFLGLKIIHYFLTGSHKKDD